MKVSGTIVLFLLPFFCLPAKKGNAQILIKGIVSDTLNNPIPFAHVILQNYENGHTLDFAYCNNKGNYVLEVEPDNGLHTLLIKYSALSYKPLEKTIDIDTQRDTTIILNVQLNTLRFNLDEIIVKAKKPSVTVRGDTVVFNASDFLRGDETVIEDLLANLPGFEIQNNGTIRFAGKEIEKVMVEDSDIFGKGYSMITKNMDPVVVEDIEVLRKYTDTPELRGIEKSDKVAINLTLQNDVRHVLFGNTRLGMGALKTYEARANMTSLNKKLHQYFFLNANSIGYNSISSLTSFEEDDSEYRQEKIGLKIEPSPLIGIYPETPPIKEEFFRDNNSELISYNLIYKPNKQIELKTVNFITRNQDSYHNQSMVNFRNSNIDIINNQFNDHTVFDFSGFSKVTAKYQINEKSRFEAQGIFSGIDQENTNKLSFNDSTTFENLDNKNLTGNYNLFYLNRLNDRNALLLYASYKFYRNTQLLASDPFLSLAFFLPEVQEATLAKQTNSIADDSFSMYVKDILKVKPSLIIENKVGYIFSSTHTKSNLVLHNSNTTNFADSNFTNDLRLKSSQVYYNSLLRKSYKNISFSGSMGVLLYTFEAKGSTQIYNRDQSEVYLNPGLRISWKLDSKNKTQARYLFNASTNILRDILPGYFFNGSQTFVKGLGELRVLRGHSFLLKYTYGKWSERLLLHSTFFYNNKIKSPVPDNTITNDIILIGKRNGGNRDAFLWNTMADLYFPSIQNNVKLSINLSKNRVRGYRTNGSSLSITSFYTNYSIEIKSVFLGRFNYSFGSSLSNQQYTSFSKIKNISSFQYFDTYLNLNKKIKLKLVLERYYFENGGPKSGLYFMNGVFTYKLKPNKWELRLRLRNMLNNNTFNESSLTNISSENTAYDLRNRLLFADIYYRF